MKYLTYTIIFSKKQYFLNLMDKLFFDDFFIIYNCYVHICVFFLIILILEVITLTQE